MWQALMKNLLLARQKQAIRARLAAVLSSLSRDVCNGPQETLLESFRFDYGYEIEYEYDFRFSNQ